MENVHPTPQPLEVGGKGAWDVDNIVDSQQQAKNLEYLTSWQGFGPDHNSWDPTIHPGNCKMLVNDSIPDSWTQQKYTREQGENMRGLIFVQYSFSNIPVKTMASFQEENWILKGG